MFTHLKIKSLNYEEDIMKKLLSIVVATMLTLVLVGCGNSPDGDGQKPNDGEYGRMSKLYGPAGDGRAAR